MKKILMTSGAALLLSAGYAAADTISFTGDARMGVVYDRNAESEFRIDSRIRGYFFFDAESDTGLEFGGRLRIDQAREGANSIASGSAGNYVYVASEFGEVRVGDVPGAGLAAAGDLHSVGFTGLGFLNEPDYLLRNFGGGLLNTAQNGALYQYDLDAFSLYAHTGAIDNPTIAPGVTMETNVGIGASYDAGMFFGGIAFEYGEINDVLGDDQDLTHLTLGGGASFDMFEVRGHFGRAGGDIGDELPSRNQFGASVQGSFDAITATAFAREDFFQDRHFGLGASYDLGGGARLDGGVRHTRYDTFSVRGDTTDTFADLGVNMSF